jgi:hypothetical protein
MQAVAYWPSQPHPEGGEPIGALSVETSMTAQPFLPCERWCRM